MLASCLYACPVCVCVRESVCVCVDDCPVRGFETAVCLAVCVCGCGCVNDDLKFSK